jgi:hypothetical protein
VRTDVSTDSAVTHWPKILMRYILNLESPFDQNLLPLGFFFFRVDMMLELFLGQHLAVGIKTHFNAIKYIPNWCDGRIKLE